MEIATAFVAVRPVSTGFGPALDAQLTPQLAATEGRIARMFSSGGALAGAAKGFAAGFIGSEVIQGLMGTADAASDLNEEVSKTGVVFDENADSVIKWSSTSASALQLSQRAALGAVGVYGDFFNTLGLGSDISADLGTRLVEVAADVASFKNVAGGAEDVSSRFFRALTGERESLKDLGIVISELDVARKAEAMGFERQSGQFSQGAKALATYELILEKTAEAQGDVARTGDEFAGQQRELEGNLEDLSAAIGGLLVPALNELATSANNVIGPVTDLLGLMDADVGSALGEGLVRGLTLAAGPFGIAGKHIADALADTGDEADSTSAKTTSLADVLHGKVVQAMEIAAKATEDAADEAKAFQDEIDSVADAFFGSMDAEANYADALRDVEDAQAGVASAQRDLTQARESAAEAERDLTEAVREQAEAQDEAALAVERADRALQSAERSARRAQRTLDEAREDQAGLARDAALAAADFGPDSRRAVEAREELEEVDARVEDAEFAVEEAHWRVEEAARAQRDAQEELASALAGTNEASDRVRDAQDRVEDAHLRVRDAADGVESAERRVAEATDEAARAAIEAEVALAAQNQTMRDSPEAAAGFLGFLDNVIAKRPDVADTLREWRTEFDLLNGTLNAVSTIDLTKEGTVGALLWGLATGTWQGSQPQGGDVGALLGGLFGAPGAAAASAPVDDGKALSGLGAKSATVEINVNGVPDLHTRAMLRDTIEDAVGHIADREDEMAGVRS